MEILLKTSELRAGDSVRLYNMNTYGPAIRVGFITEGMTDKERAELRGSARIVFTHEEGERAGKEETRVYSLERKWILDIGNITRTAYERRLRVG
jgi:hypothetical protein